MDKLNQKNPFRLPDQYKKVYTIQHLVAVKSVVEGLKKQTILDELSTKLDIGKYMLYKWMALEVGEDKNWRLSQERIEVLASYFDVSASQILTINCKPTNTEESK